MPEALAWALGLLAFLFVLMISVGLHEGGHMVVAKFFKLNVPKFFIGFGRTIWSFKTSKTEYGIKAVPLGGFVAIEDPTQDDEAPEKVLLSHVSPWKRTLIYLAGPAVNIILGTVILVTMLMTVPLLMPTNEVKTANTCEVALETGASCTGAQAGLIAGDVIAKIDGEEVATSADFARLLEGKTVTDLEVERNGEIVYLTSALEDYKLGINLASKEVYRTFGESLTTMGEIFVLNVEALVDLPSKLPGVVESIFGAPVDPEAPSSIIAVGKTYGDVSADTEIAPLDKFQTLMMYSGLFNIGLGFINLLPIPPLDGGRILIAVFDTFKMGWSKVLRKKYNPVSYKMISTLTAVSAAVVFGYMALLMLSDIVQISRGTM